MSTAAEDTTTPIFIHPVAIQRAHSGLPPHKPDLARGGLGGVEFAVASLLACVAGTR